MDPTTTVLYHKFGNYRCLAFAMFLVFHGKQVSGQKLKAASYWFHVKFDNFVHQIGVSVQNICQITREMGKMCQTQ